MTLSRSESGKLGGLTFSKNNALRKEAARLEYERNPERCINPMCSNAISFEKVSSNSYCSRSCAASVNNRKNPKRKAKPKAVSLSRSEHTQQKLTAGLISDRGTLKRLLTRGRGHKCELCTLETWQGQSIPIELDHIDGNAGNNIPANLRLLCPNCHAQTPTAKGKNKGNGRKSRGLPLS